MSPIRTIHLNLFSKPVVIEICLITNIKCENIKSVITQLNCALINPKFICSYDQLTTAITKTVNNHLSKTMKTRSPYTELLFSLSPSSNVTESLKIFGVEETASEAIVVRFSEHSSTESSSSTLISDLESILNCQFEEFSIKFCDLNLVKQVYKPSNEDRLIGEICSGIATKNI